MTVPAAGEAVRIRVLKRGWVLGSAIPGLIAQQGVPTRQIACRPTTTVACSASAVPLAAPRAAPISVVPFA